MLLSIAFVYSASASIAQDRFGSPDKLFLSHIFRVCLGLIALFVFIKIDYHIWQRFSKYIIFGSLVPLLLVFFIGTSINGAYRWLYIGPLNFQPSELAKFALVIHFAALLTQRQEVIKDFKYGMLPFLVWSSIICLLIAFQPNFSSAAVIFLIGMAMLLIGNARIKHLLDVLLTSLAGLIIYALSAPYRIARLESYIGLARGDTIKTDASFQSQQAIIAFGNGGIYGLGPGQSRQSLLYLPESYGDFIFSIIGEEYGFIGTFLILVLFVIFAWRGLKVAKQSPDSFGYYLASGIVLTITIYAFVSGAVNSGLLPTTGLPMPLISYGGTAIIFYCAAIGILLNISSQKSVE